MFAKRKNEDLLSAAGVAETNDPDQRKLRDEYDELAARHIRENPLSTDETKALGDYVFNSSPINNHLRGISMAAHANRKEQTARHARLLKAAISRQRTEREMTLYRGLNLSHVEGELKVGDVISDPAFSSTSYDPAVAQSFAEEFMARPTLMAIKVPKGSPVLLTHADKQNLEYAQYEAVLNSRQRLRVTGIEDNGATVHLELI